MVERHSCKMDYLSSNLSGAFSPLMLKATGIVSVTPGRIVCNVPYDLVRYLRQLIYWEFPNLIGGLDFARHKPHITLAQPKLNRIDQKSANRYDGLKVNFEYSPDIYIGGFRKGFVGFYTEIQSEVLDRIRREVITYHAGRPASLHLSICNSKQRHITDEK